MEVQRFTKYPLLLENIAKYTGTSCSADSRGPRQQFRECGVLEASHVFALNSCENEFHVYSNLFPLLFRCPFFPQRSKRKKKRWKELKSVARKSWTTSTRRWKRLKTNRLGSQLWSFFFLLSTNQHSNVLRVFCPKETARVPETDGHLITEARRPPHDPGAEGKKHQPRHVQEEPDRHHHSPHTLMLR